MLDRELEDELATHIEFATEENISRGMDFNEARREALRRFGSRDAARELNRDARALPLLEGFVQDVRHGTRLLGRNPLFALTAAASLALGIGADITVFSVANAFLFQKPAGVSDGAGLVEVSLSRNGEFGIEEISQPNLVDIRRRATTIEDVCGYESHGLCDEPGRPGRRRSHPWEYGFNELLQRSRRPFRGGALVRAS